MCETQEGKGPLKGFPAKMALKVIPLRKDKHGEVKRLQQQEIELMRRLSELGDHHPNIVRILHSEVQKGIELIRIML